MSIFCPSRIPSPTRYSLPKRQEREFFIGNILVQIHFINVMISWTDLVPSDFELPLSGSLTSTFLPPVPLNAQHHALAPTFPTLKNQY